MNLISIPATKKKKHGPPDFLLNNAALMNRRAPLWEVSAQEFSDVVDVNIKGVAKVFPIQAEF